MKRLPIFAGALLLCCSGADAAESAANPQHAQVLALVKEVQAQQTVMAENQAKIEAKLATVAEAVRVARIYSSRSGN